MQYSPSITQAEAELADRNLCRWYAHPNGKPRSRDERLVFINVLSYKVIQRTGVTAEEIDAVWLEWWAIRASLLASTQAQA
jgi:hypothetical protein